MGTIHEQLAVVVGEWVHVLAGTECDAYYPEPPNLVGVAGDMARWDASEGMYVASDGMAWRPHGSPEMVLTWSAFRPTGQRFRLAGIQLAGVK